MNMIFLLPAGGTLFDIVASHSCTFTEKSARSLCFTLKRLQRFGVTLRSHSCTSTKRSTISLDLILKPLPGFGVSRKLSAFSLLFVIFFSAAFISCQKAINEDASLTSLDLKQVSYGSNTANNMDIYLPAGRNSDSTKVILFIHGGSWSGGDKTDFDDAITAIRSKVTGYAILNINYRLANNGINTFPAQIDDIQAALTFIESRAGEYRINTNKVCLIGASAGAHLALLEAYKNNSLGKIKAIVDLFGPTDLTDLYNNHPFPEIVKPILINFLGTTPDTNPTLYFQASPINYVTAQSVPTKIFHGSDDIVVPIGQSYTLKSKLEANNVKVEMTVYTGEGHGWVGNNLTDTYNQSVQFIKENVR